MSVTPTASLRQPASGNRVLAESFKRVPPYSYCSSVWIVVPVRMIDSLLLESCCVGLSSGKSRARCRGYEASLRIGLSSAIGILPVKSDEEVRSQRKRIENGGLDTQGEQDATDKQRTKGRKHSPIFRCPNSACATRTAGVLLSILLTLCRVASRNLRLLTETGMKFL